MKKFSFGLLGILLAGFFLSACTADYDTFGTSDYHDLSEISFVEQDGTPSVYAAEHRMIFTLKAPEDSADTWDSVTVSDIDMSHLATLHLVDSKFEEFPSDSLALDSLAGEVSYAKAKLKKKSRIRVPASLQVYVVIVSESGEKAIWQLQFKIPGVEASSSSTEGSASGSSSSGDVSDKNSSSSAKSSSSSAAKKSSETGLGLKFKNQVRLDTISDTLVAKFPVGMALEDLGLESWTLAEKASVSPSPDSVKAWSEFQSFTVTAEDGSEKIWVLHISIAGATDVLYISAKGETQAASISESEKSIVLYFGDSAAFKSAEIDSLLLSDGATSTLKKSGLDLSSTQTFDVSFGDEASTWKISGALFVPAVPPELFSVAVGQGSVAGQFNADSTEIFFEMSYDTDLDLRALSLTELSLSDGAEASVSAGETLDLSRRQTVTVKNSAGDERTYVLQAGYQYPGSDFNTWVSDDFGNTNDVVGWDNGNNSTTKTLTVNENKTAVKMETKSIVGKLASGNMLTAYFNPKGVGVLSMAGYPDGNELIDFGRPFYGRPAYVEFDVKYEGKGDSCDLYVLLENRSRTSNEGKNQFRTSGDVNTLVASAWYRATTVDSEDDPDVVSISPAAREGYTTIRLKFQYGEPLEGSPIFASSVFTTSLQKTAGIDNHLVSTDSPENFDVTHIRIVMASSALGNLYEGTTGATLYCDEIRLIY